MFEKYVPYHINYLMQSYLIIHRDCINGDYLSHRCVPLLIISARNFYLTDKEKSIVSWATTSFEGKMVKDHKHSWDGNDISNTNNSEEHPKKREHNWCKQFFCLNLVKDNDFLRNMIFVFVYLRYCLCGDYNHKWWSWFRL